MLYWRENIIFVKTKLCPMRYAIHLPLPEGWVSSTRTTKEAGETVTRLEAYLPDDRAQKDKAEIDVMVGPMPPDSDAQEQALLNYTDMVGFDPDDPEDSDPLTVWPFGGKRAYGFECLVEDDSPMRVMCVGIRQGALAIITVVGETDAVLAETVRLVERVKVTEA